MTKFIDLSKTKSIIAKNAQELETTQQLLNKNLPNNRIAYSDRTAWLMACFSELAYIRFNSPFSNEKQEELITECLEKIHQETKKPMLLSLLDIVGYDPKAELERLKLELDLLNAKLENTFDSEGTQAILISTDNFIVLSFRGTESTSVKDIKTDIKAAMTQCETGGKVHRGFKAAFEAVEMDIQNTLNQEEWRNKPLFITGHSLGGALATIAAKRLKHEGNIAGCYTYGAPRVGDEEWISGIKTQVNRVVNAADCVTMLPPSKTTIYIINWLFSWIPYIGKSISSFLSTKLGDYLDAGDMKYLTNCKNGNYSSVKLLFSVSTFHRIHMSWKKSTSWNKFLADHSISIYRKKLAVIAIRRN